MSRVPQADSVDASNTWTATCPTRGRVSPHGERIRTNPTARGPLCRTDGLWIPLSSSVGSAVSTAVLGSGPRASHTASEDLATSETGPVARLRFPCPLPHKIAAELYP